MNWVDWTKAIFAAIGSIFVWFVGGLDVLATTLLIVVAMDYLTGIIAAIINKQLSSSVGFRGILKKVLIIIAVGLATRIDELIGQPLCRTLVCTFYVINESLSILENLGRAGVQYPAKLREIILALNKKEDTAAPAAIADTSDKLGQ